MVVTHWQATTADMNSLKSTFQRHAERFLLQRLHCMMLRPLASRLLTASGVVVSQTRFARRGPPRLFGKTKSQYLDTLMRSNANICAAISFSFFPIVIYYIYRYNFVLKPAREEIARKEKEALLAEGKAEA